jgi:hypothetical protein
MTLRLNGSTSGYTEIDAPAVAGSNTLTLPGGNGTNGQVLTTDGAGALSFTTVAGAGSLADGSAAAPSVAFASDVNTGLFRAGNRTALAFYDRWHGKSTIRCKWQAISWYVYFCIGSWRTYKFSYLVKTQAARFRLHALALQRSQLTWFLVEQEAMQSQE